MKSHNSVVIIGAGPAGLGCAYELTKNKQNVIIFEKNALVGGLARSHYYKGCYFDVGPHRFYTKNKEVLQTWKEILKDEFLEVKRLTRMLYKNKLFYYPVRLKDVIVKLGLLDSILTFLSFVYAKLFFRSLNPKTFEEWITKQFGKKLYLHFFKTYTEKVWGIPCHKIGAEWASQRIKNLNFIEVVKNAILGERANKAKSLIEKFYYPSKGSGYCYEKMAQFVQKRQGSINLNSSIVRIHHKNGRMRSIVVDGKEKEHVAINHLFSSMPLTQFIFALYPKPPHNVLQAAKKLFYRDHITVNLIVKKTNLFSDNWIYVHAPEVQMARITNYNNFSKHMVKNKNYSAISVEYFAFQTDDIWKMSDAQLIELAKNEMEQVKLLRKEDVIDGFVVKETESYPTYYLGYKRYFNILKDYVNSFTNLHLIGRGGMYKYNNMDHSLYSGMLAARNYLLGYKKYSLWDINEDAEYFEESKKS